MPTDPTPAVDVRHPGGCLQPVLLRGRVDQIDGATGELLHRSTLDVATLRHNVTSPGGTTAAALDVLKAQKEVDAARLAAIGYCFGGTTALEIGRSGADVKAIVGFHSGLVTVRPQDARNIKGKVLVCIGADDPIIPPEQRAAFETEMKAAGIDWRLQLYGGAGHSFTNPAADSRGMKGFFYHEATDRRSWNAMIELFNETLK